MKRTQPWVLTHGKQKKNIQNHVYGGRIPFRGCNSRTINSA